MKKRRSLKWIIFFLIAFSLLFGCSGKGKDVKKIEGDPERIYKEGLAKFNKRDYPEALKKFEELKSSFPDSPPFTIWAELKIGDCNFLDKKYVEAIAAYEEFKKIHPSHEEIPYVQYQIGMSYYNQMLTPDRDQTPTKKALSSFEYLIVNYPPSLFTDKAKEKVGVCTQRLADNEFYVGNFYYKEGKFQAAAARFEGLLEKFPRNPGEDKTLYLLGKSYLELDQWQKAEGAFMKIVTDYSKSPHYKEAKSILDKGLTDKKVSLRKSKTKGSKKKGEIADAEPEKVAMVKFEEERKQPVSLKEEKIFEPRDKEERLASLPVTSEWGKLIPSKEEAKGDISHVAIEPIQEDRVRVLSPSVEAKKDISSAMIEPAQEGQVRVFSPSIEAKKDISHVAIEPIQEDRVRVLSPSVEAKKDISSVMIEPAQEDRVRVLPPSVEAKKVISPAMMESTQEGQVRVFSPSIEAKKVISSAAIEPIQEDRALAIPPHPEAKKVEPIGSVEPIKEDRTQVLQSSSSVKTAPKKKVKADEKKQIAALPSTSISSKEQEKVKKGGFLETKEAKLLDTSQAIDITSDKVETYWKENLIVFKGNAIARQKDIVIYADSLEAVIIEDGKGIDRVTAGGNVKIQQGLRVANCQKAIFYNLDRKVVLTGDPKISEGDNIVSGDEIIFDIEKDRFEVKGGTSGRGKVKIQSEKEIEKLK
jgi:outer membrane protein assembly factor BamD